MAETTDPVVRPHELYIAELLEEIEYKAAKHKKHIREKNVTDHTLMVVISDMKDRQSKLEDAYAVRQAIIKTR